MSPQTAQPLPLPPEIPAVLESTFQRLLAESTFADAWPMPELASDDEAPLRCPLQVILPLSSPWKGRILIAGDRETVFDLAAGFHSLPDEMVDEGIALDFLAEIGGLLARDLFCGVDLPVTLMEPSAPDLAIGRAFWQEEQTGRAALGCNGGRMITALRSGIL